MKLTEKYIKVGIALFSAVCLAVFYIAWQEPTMPADLSIIPLSIFNTIGKIKERDKQLQAADSAEKIINSLLQKKPNDLSLRFSQGLYYMFIENYAEAISIHSHNLKYLDSINNKTIYDWTIKEIARNYCMQGEKLLAKDKNNTQAAINSLRKSFDYIPYYAPSVIELANWNIDNNRTDSAKMLLDESIKLNPGNVVLYTTLGYAYFKENNLTESENYFLRARNLDPDNADANKFLKMLQNRRK